MKTKRMLGILSLALVILLGFNSCKKDQANNSQPVSIAEKIAADENFMKLNNAMNRFDPQYLILVYHDARTPKAISDASIEILKKMAADPNNPAIQKELAGFYHLNSVAEFSIYSNNISESIKELDRKFNFTKEVTENNKGEDFLKARIIYARKEYNKLTESLSRPQRNLEIAMEGVPDWQDYTNQLIDYFRYSMNQGFQGDQDYGVSCDSEPCCEKRIICKNNAWKNFLTNFALYAGTGLGAGGAVGLKVGAIVAPSTGIFAPFTTLLVGALGALGGGSAGAIIAWGIYNSDIDNCEATYRICKN